MLALLIFVSLVIVACESSPSYQKKPGQYGDVQTRWERVASPATGLCYDAVSTYWFTEAWGGYWKYRDTQYIPVSCGDERALAAEQ